MAAPRRFEYFASGSTTSILLGVAVSERLVAIARILERAPWNRPGSDKTWVLRAMEEHWRFHGEVRRSQRRSQRVGAR